jgi:hypothetical protein
MGFHPPHISLLGPSVPIRRPWIDAPDETVDITVLEGDIYFVPDLSGDHVYTLQDWTVPGTTIKFHFRGVAHKITVKNTLGTTICELGVGAGQYQNLELITNGAAHDWRIIGGSGLV